ncbi:MAG TPA: hypothetical protein VFF84_07310 [Sphingobium sp.]|nr:hypothetical protein [Sphingobium sp.]
MSELREDGQRKIKGEARSAASIERTVQIPVSSTRNDRKVSRNINLSHLDPAFVAELRNHLPAQTAECIQNAFGISANTWMKLSKGMPIRQSVAKRLMSRFGVKG